MQISVRTLTVLSFFLLVGFGTVLVAQDRSGSRSDRPREGGPPTSFQGGPPSSGERPQWGGGPPAIYQQGQGGPPQRVITPGGGQPPWGGPPQATGAPTGRGGAPPTTGAPAGRGGPVPVASPGTPPGGTPADRTNRMMDMFRSMDTNRNGILEPSEITDSRRGFVTAIVTRFGIDPNRPINLADLERRAQAANAVATPPTNTNSSNTANSGRTDNRSDVRTEATGGGGNRSSAQPVDPLVPPFGEQKPVETAVLGFGQKTGAATTASTRPGRGAPNQPQQAQSAPATTRQSAVYDQLPAEVRNNPALDWFFAYDRDRDGQLSMQEYGAGRGGVWTPEIAKEFRFLDKNGDGFATIDEVLASLKEYDDQRAADAALEAERYRTSVPVPSGSPVPQPVSRPVGQPPVAVGTPPTPVNVAVSPADSRGGPPQQMYNRGNTDPNRSSNSNSSSSSRQPTSRSNNYRGGAPGGR